MLNKMAMSASVIALMAVGSAQAKGMTPVTADEVVALQKAWGEGIVDIGQAFTDGGDYRAAAEEHLKKFYAYGEEEVLFKPTLANEDQFRGTFEEALSYFVTGTVSEDKGFAIAPYTKVRWENEGTIVDSDSALSMGNYYFTKTDGSETKVEYSFGIDRMGDGQLKIVLHHSSLPYSPK